MRVINCTWLFVNYLYPGLDEPRATHTTGLRTLDGDRLPKNDL